MSLTEMPFQQLLELQTEHRDVLLELCRVVETTFLTPELERELKPKFDAANAAMAEVNAEIKKRRAEMQVRS